jgi:hypothetical protein
MANSINDLLTIFDKLGDPQRANRFEVLINGPISPSLSAPASGFFATAVQIPAHVVEYYEDSLAPSGSYIEVPIKRQYDQIFKIDFIVDSGWEVRTYFENWVDLIFPDYTNDGKTVFKNSRFVNYWDNIVGNVIINCLDANGTPKKSITLTGAYPGTLVPGQFSNDLANTHTILQVDMNYRNYTITDPTT